MNNPLVSVIVITYKSAPYVIETLQSVFDQTYGNIELIISDDCSPDNTLDVIKEWVQGILENPKTVNRFVSVNVVQTTNNQGISHNCNNGLIYATGKWIKYIAGDDILTVDCIESFVNATKKSDDKFFICGLLHFTNNSDVLSPSMSNIQIFSKDFFEQEIMLVKHGPIIPGPAMFICRNTLLKLGGFEENYPFVEDYPLAMKFIANGYRINLIEKYLIRYRVYPESASKGNDRFGDSIFRAIEDYSIPAALHHKMYLYWWHYLTCKIIRQRRYPSVLLYLLRATDLIFWKNKIRSFLS